MNPSNYQELMAELRTEYLESFDEKYKLMNTYFDSKNWESLELEFHKLKGTGSTYGVPEVTQLGEQLEKVCHSAQGLPRETFDKALVVLNRIRQKYMEDIEFDFSSDPDWLSLKK